MAPDIYRAFLVLVYINQYNLLSSRNIRIVKIYRNFFSYLVIFL